jgi:hypothetical protein
MYYCRVNVIQYMSNILAQSRRSLTMTALKRIQQWDCEEDNAFDCIAFLDSKRGNVVCMSRD